MSFDKKFITQKDFHTIDFVQESGWDISNAIKNPKTTSAVLEKIASVPSNYMVRTAIAENPNVTNKALKLVAENMSHRWEWRAVWNTFIKRVTDSEAIHDKNTPYASFILNSKLSNPEYVAGYFSVAGGAMAEDLWHDLASRKILELGYREDSYDGDHFGPLWDDKVSEFDGSPAEYILSPGYFCEWISRKQEADLGWVSENLTGILSDDPEWIIERFIEDSIDDLPLLFAACHGLVNKHLTVADSDAFDNFVVETMLDYDSEMLDVEVSIDSDPEHLQGPRFADLSADDIMHLTENLLLASNHYIPKNFRITPHLLSLVLLHPNTPQEVKDKIIAADVAGMKSTLEFVTSDK